MKIGYPCINRSIGCTSNTTFRLASYSEDLLKEKVSANLACLKKILSYNAGNGLLFFRISSDVVPFASHPVCTVDWRKHFRKQFAEIGRFIRSKNMRISMHPDQFILLNSPKKDVVSRSISELEYHCRVLDLMGLDTSAKIQIHVGGVYNEREQAVKRFEDCYHSLSRCISRRLVIENDERLFSLRDCLSISRRTGVPVLFDSFHHECLNNGETPQQAIRSAQQTWKEKDGNLMVDYSSQQKGKRMGKHTEHIDSRHFREFIRKTKGIDFDIMLEIKDKEKSALKALGILREMKRI